MGCVQVTRDNFRDLLPSIKNAIDHCDFLTIDTELTGLAVSRAQQYNLLDTPQDRYGKVRHSAMNFGLLQYGLATFKYNQMKDEYEVQCWSFYLWPRTTTSAEAGRYITMQLSSIEFLINYGYDFNLTFSKGIPFLSRADEEYKRAQIKKSKEAASEPLSDVNIQALPEADKAFLETQMSYLEKFVKAGKFEEPFEVPVINGFLRRLIHQEVPKRFGNAVKGRIPLVVKDGKERHCGMKILFVTPEELIAHQNESYAASIERLGEEFGFSRVIIHVMASKKPVIGHNCFMDFLHTYQKFLDKLPEYYAEFKTAFHANFETVFDTKYFAASILDMHGSDSTSLGDMYHYLLRHDATKDVCKAMAGDGGEEKFHDAGFDAYCTGQVFIGLAAFVGQQDGKCVKDAVTYILANKAPYDLANRLFMMQSDCDGFYLAGPEDEPDRTAICHISGFDSSIKTSHLQAALGKAGFALEGSAFIWFNEECCFVRMESDEAAKRASALKSLALPVGPRAEISSYACFASKQLPAKRKLP